MRPRDWGLLFLLSILWGGTFFFAAVALKEWPPLTLVLARCAIAAVVLVPILLALRFDFPRDLAGWRDFAVMAVLNNIIPFSLIFWGQQSIPSGLAAVLNATTPLMSLLVLRALAAEPLAAHKLAGIVIGLFGVVVLIGPEAMAPTKPGFVMGMLAVLGGTLSYGFSGWWGRRLKAYAPPVSAASQLTCSTLLLLPVVAVTDRFWTLPLPSAGVLAAVLALALLSTALAYILFFEIMRSAGPLNVMLVTLLIPFSAIALGTLVLGETLLPRHLAGAAVIGLSLLVIDGRLFGSKPA
jgi:drug/metabolite transporter (DMT)-like permease